MTEAVEAAASETEFTNWFGQQRHYRRNLIAVLTKPFQFTEEQMTSEKVQAIHMNETLKILIERDPVKITGLSRSYRLDQTGQLVPIPSAPVISWHDVYGQPIRMFFEKLGELYRQYGRGGLGFDVLFFETDPTYTIVTDAWEIIDAQVGRVNIPDGERNIESDTPTAGLISAGFYAHQCKVGPETIEKATVAMKNLSVMSANPHTRSSYGYNVPDSKDAVVA